MLWEEQHKAGTLGASNKMMTEGTRLAASGSTNAHAVNAAVVGLLGQNILEHPI